MKNASASPPSKLTVAVVGHTNTGKTSLVRTLTRDTRFGEVSNRPATTRHVEGTVLLVDGAPLVELYDTPGLEDPMGLLEHLESLRGGRRCDWIDVINEFLAEPAGGPFGQEAKAIRQVLASDVALYVVDARDRVLGKHRDELEILGRCARPVVPVLNFTAGGQARTPEWREHLARINMHAVAEFDTVVLDETSEQRLFEKMRTLLDPFRPTLNALIAERERQRAGLIHAASDMLADLLIDVAACRLLVPEQLIDERDASLERLKQMVREREQQCVNALLELFRFEEDDYAPDALPISDGRWGSDLFSPASLRAFGIRAGGGAAAGAAAGVAIDVMTGGLTLGAAAALGATLGALWSSLGSHGRRLLDVFQGYTELRVADETLRLLAARQLDLIAALLRRGHASQDKLRLNPAAEAPRSAWVSGPLPDEIDEARLHPDWSRLDGSDGGGAAASERHGARDRLARTLARSLAPASGP
jgi:hypothetical protein